MTRNVAPALLAACSMGAASASGTWAQTEPNPALDALNPAIILSEGFPQSVIVVQGGGPIIVASDPTHGCPVRATEAPTITLRMDEDLPKGFDIYAQADASAALLVITPEGDWLCSSGSGDNPAVRRIADPVAGDYQVWVSEEDRSDEAPVQITLTEVELVGRGLNAVPQFSIQTDGSPFEATFMGEARRIAQGKACDAIVEEVRPSYQILMSTPDGAESLPGMSMVGIAQDTYGLIFQDPSGDIACQLSDTPSVGTIRTLINRPAGVYRVWVTAQHTTAARLLVTIPD